MAELIAYLNKVGSQYTPRRHATVVAFMVQTFGVTAAEAEDAIAQWLESRA